MTSAENKAAFLSYASQDAEAAKRIAEALRAAGVEVWFDQNELVGGDAWDPRADRLVRAVCAGDFGGDAGAAGRVFPDRVETRGAAHARDGGRDAVSVARPD
jgi:hypothetical protein